MSLMNRRLRVNSHLLGYLIQWVITSRNVIVKLIEIYGAGNLGQFLVHTHFQADTASVGSELTLAVDLILI